MPFLVPFAPTTFSKFSDVVTRIPIWKEEKRSDYINSKKIRKQPKISRKWTKGEEGESDNDGN